MTVGPKREASCGIDLTSTTTNNKNSSTQKRNTNLKRRQNIPPWILPNATFPPFYFSTSKKHHQQTKLIIRIQFQKDLQKQKSKKKKKTMSFQDLEAGVRVPPQNPFNAAKRKQQQQSQSQSQDPSQAVAAAIFQINTAVSSFYRLVNSLGTPKDTLDLRDKL